MGRHHWKEKGGFENVAWWGARMMRWQRFCAMRHTSPVRAEARAGTTGKRLTLGRIKVRPRIVQSRKERGGRESFDQQHGSRALRTITANRMGGSAGWSGIIVEVLLSEQLLAQWQQVGPAAVGQETEGSDADEAARQNV